MVLGGEGEKDLVQEVIIVEMEDKFGIYMTLSHGELTKKGVLIRVEGCGNKHALEPQIMLSNPWRSILICPNAFATLCSAMPSLYPINPKTSRQRRLNSQHGYLTRISHLMMRSYVES